MIVSDIETEIRKRVAEALEQAQAGDDERVHIAEDDLYLAFIRYVSEQGGELGRLADIVLETNTIEFARWCA